MKSTKELLHQIHDPHLSIDERTTLRCSLAKHLEEVGNYDAAREALGELWGDIGVPPKLENLSDRTAAEVLLRVGTLTGWIGSTHQIESSQETAKNLITQSISIFESLHDLKKVAEAQTELGYCYWREGAMDDARVVLEQALRHLDDADGDLKAVALLRSAAVEKVQNRLNDAAQIFRNAAPLFERSSNHTIRGRFHNEFASVLRRLGDIENCAEYIDRAVIEYTAASFHFDEAGHARYQACVENNLALLYLRTNRLAEAHEHLDRAQALFTRLDDSVHLAQVDETRARVMLDEGTVAKAEKLANSAVKMLEKGGEQSLLAEALTTHGIALVKLHDEKTARQVFSRGITVAEQAGDLDSAGVAALTLFEQLAERLSDDEICDTLDRAYELLKDTRNAATYHRLTVCLRRALSMIHTSRPDWSTFSLEQTLHRHQARYIQMALEDAGGVISQAARLLGLPRHTNLHYMLRNPHRNVLAAITAATHETALNEDLAQDSGASQKVQTIRILLVEDNDIVAGAVEETLETKGWAVETCSDGTAAQERIDSDAHYDLLLLDYDLPGVNGIELVHRARKLTHRSQTPIIVLSATPVEAAALNAGADEFLSKPKGVSSLVETISRLLSEREQGSGRA